MTVFVAHDANGLVVGVALTQYALIRADTDGGAVVADIVRLIVPLEIQ